MNAGRLQGKAAVITGGSAALGRAMARALVREGARVLLVDLDATALEPACRVLDYAVSSVASDVWHPTDARRY